MFARARIADRDSSTIRAVRQDGAVAFVPRTLDNHHYAQLMRRVDQGGLQIGAYARWDTLEQAQRALIEEIKEFAGTHVYASYPLHVQLNAIGQGGAMRAWINSVRQRSTVKEAEVSALADLDAAESYDVTAGWPAAQA